MPRRAKKDVEHNPLEKGFHAGDIKKFVELCLQAYFAKRKWFCGGPIPESELYSDFSFRTVLRTQFDDQWEHVVHNQCLVWIQRDPSYQSATLSWPVYCLLGILAEMRAMGIPKEFQPGMVYLYFKFCKGVKVPPPPLL